MGINRNIVECKLVIDPKRTPNAYVLIETLWNVNITRKEKYLYELCVLIETLWNVNLEQSPTMIRLMGINRNIVECK